MKKTKKMPTMTSFKNYQIFSVKKYNEANQQFIKHNAVEFETIESISQELMNDNFYHFRVHPKEKYVFFGDVDGLEEDIDYLIGRLQAFLLNFYGLELKKNEVKYTANDSKTGSYHYSIPKWNCFVEKLKEIHQNFIKSESDVKKCIDITVYSEHWFRCPNQSKGCTGKNDRNSKHIIINGKIDDFVIDNIPDSSENIDNTPYIEEKINPEKNMVKNKTRNISTSIVNFEKEIKQKNSITNYYNEEQILCKTLSTTKLYKKIFDECYKQERFENYSDWLSIGMAIKNTFTDNDMAFDLFDYYSAKGSNYEGCDKTKYKFASFGKKDDKGYTVATIHYYAIEDNKPKFIEIMNKNTFELGQTDMCQYLKLLAGYKFVYKVYGAAHYKLYCYNGKYWQNDDVIFKHCLTTVLYDFLKMILIEAYWNTKDFNSLKSKIEKLKLVGYKKDLVETYKEYGVNNTISFDDKWWLFGFTNIVYDMESKKLREYEYDDYVSTTCGYEWREPTNNEINTLRRLIEMIMPIKEERDAYLQILCTGIDGRCLEKFVIFNGCGGNGKGVMNDLMLLALGNYAMLGNNGILFEESKTGSNPEKANLHKKRYVVFREPPEKKKFENAVVKELTGGGMFSARTHHENETQKELNLTMIVECNKRPLFAEEPREAELRRIIDTPFRSTFTEDATLWDESNYIFPADSEYKTKTFQEQHKYALLKILFEEHKKYLANNCKIILPKNIVERTNLYLELSCTILQWFKNNYKIFDKEGQNPIKIKDIHDSFSESEYFKDLSKSERRKYTKMYFADYFENNIFLRKYFRVRYSNLRSVILGWEKIAENND